MGTGAVSMEQTWGSSWAPGAWADGAWGQSDVVVPQPQPQTGGGGGGGSSRRRRSSSSARSNPRVYGGDWVRVDDDDTRREREEREAQRKQAVAEEIQRSLARLDEIEQERKRAAEVHAVVDLGGKGKVAVGSGSLEFEVTPCIAIASGGLVEAGSGSIAFEIRDARLTGLYESNAALASELETLRAEKRRMKRDMEALEVLMLAA